MLKSRFFSFHILDNYRILKFIIEKKHTNFNKKKMSGFRSLTDQCGIG